MSWLALLLTFLAPQSAQAACASPVGVAGQMQYMAPDYKYCDGSSWVSMALNPASGSCSAAGSVQLGTSVTD